MPQEPEQKRYIVLYENLHTGEIQEDGRYNDPKFAAIAKSCWNFGNHQGWIKDTKTGEIF